MLTERRVMERYLLERRGTLAFLVKYVEYSLETIQHNWLLPLNLIIMSRGAVKTF